MSLPNPEQPAVKDKNASHPIATTWRPTLREVVRALAQGDFTLARGIPNVSPISPKSAGRIQRYLDEFGQSLAELPEDTWRSSISQWMEDHWEILLDLWTVEAGRSDLVLFARVFERDGEFQFEIESLHVP
jgi:hypothetical protein